MESSEPPEIRLFTSIDSSNLCFSKDEFFKEDFDVDQFIVKYRKKVDLETLRQDLGLYLKILRTSMIELINRDYADFVNLSSNLVGLNKAISNLKTPLVQLKQDIQTTLENISNVGDELAKTLAEKTSLDHARQMLIDFQYIHTSIERLEASLQKGSGSSGSFRMEAMERQCVELAYLSRLFTQYGGCALIKQNQSRFQSTRDRLHRQLEVTFIQNLKERQFDLVAICLRCYGHIEIPGQAETIFRCQFVRPYVQKYLTDEFIADNPLGLRGALDKVTEFLPHYYQPLVNMTSGPISGDVIMGFDFMLNSIWPEVTYCLETYAMSVFAAGNPDLFHQNYTIMNEFIGDLERHCLSQAAVQRLRQHSSYQSFMQQWNLVVYFQIRFQQIAGALEEAIETFQQGKEEPRRNQGDGAFRTRCVDQLWSCLLRCWDAKIYLPSLFHRFWKLTLQLLGRFVSFLDEWTTTLGSKRHPQPDRIGSIVDIVCDIQSLSSKIPEFFDSSIRPQLRHPTLKENALFRDSLLESRDLLQSKVASLLGCIEDLLLQLSSVHLKLINDIPRLYRKTNREAPKTASSYVENLLQPLRQFQRTNEVLLGEKLVATILQNVVTNLAKQMESTVTELLSSVRKMEESLRRLKRVKDKPTPGSGLSDDDKIRQQVLLDVTEFKRTLDDIGQGHLVSELVKKAEDELQSATMS